MDTFGSWLRARLMNDNTVGDQLYLLAASPSSTVLHFQGYEINGNTFYTIAQDKKSTNQNSGVRYDATDENGKKHTYYFGSCSFYLGRSCKMYFRLSRTLGNVIQSKKVTRPTSRVDLQQCCHS